MFFRLWVHFFFRGWDFFVLIIFILIGIIRVLTWCFWDFWWSFFWGWLLRVIVSSLDGWKLFIFLIDFGSGWWCWRPIFSCWHLIFKFMFIVLRFYLIFWVVIMFNFMDGFSTFVFIVNTFKIIIFRIRFIVMFFIIFIFGFYFMLFIWIIIIIHIFVIYGDINVWIH